MLLKEKIILLKNGQTAILRSPTHDDIPQMISYLNKSAAESEFLMRTPEEVAVMYTPEGEKAVFDRYAASENDLMIVCIVNGELAGNCSFNFGRHYRNHHTGEVGIALIKKYWGLGIGSAMFDEMIRVAKEKEGAEQLELDFVEGNVRARALYEKKGFRITGVRPDAIRMNDGRLAAEYRMMLKLH